MTSSIYNNDNKLISSLNARIFSIKANIAFGKQFLELNPEESPVRKEINKLIQEQIGYEIEVTEVKDNLTSILDSLKNKAEKNNLSSLEIENQAKNLLKAEKVNSVLKKLKGLKEDNLVESLTRHDFEIKVNEVYQQSANLIDKAFKSGLIIVFLGARGAGKSSFLNYLRGVENFDNDSVATNVVEQTLEPQFITLNHVENMDEYRNLLKLWDFPGLGTDNFPIDEYKLMVQYLPVDAYVYIYKTRFTEHDYDMIKYFIEKKEKVFILRNFADQDLQTVLKQNNKESIDDIDDDLLKEYINEFWPIVSKQHEEESNKINAWCGKEMQVYYVSCILRKHFDNERFLQELIVSLPKAKAAVMLFVIQLKSLAFFKKKFDVIKQSIIPMWVLEGILIVEKSGYTNMLTYLIRKISEIFKFYGLEFMSTDDFGVGILLEAFSDQNRSGSITESIIKTSIGIVINDRSPRECFKIVEKNKEKADLIEKKLLETNNICFERAIAEVISIE